MTDRPARPYLRPVPRHPDPPGVRSLAGGLFGFAEIEVLHRGRPAERLPADAVLALYPEAEGALARLTAARAPIAGIEMTGPAIMGIVNVTPDSFSDGGKLGSAEAAIAHGLALAEAGAAILDIGGESTRPGADEVSADEEIDRILPVIEGLAARTDRPLSIDTRKAPVAFEALEAGARIVNDVAAMTFDPAMPRAAAKAEGVCLMHAQGSPQTMQRDPTYDDVQLDIYDWLERRVQAAEDAGIPRARLMLDPGIGFGKTLEHNLALIRGLSLFHGLGTALLLGASRKAFIGTLSGEKRADHRAPGSIAAALAGLGQGAQIVRVHDVAETAQAIRVWQAIERGG